MNKEIITEKIKIWGIVQGVGFRPFVAKLADKMGMKGEVLNIGGLVDVILTDTKDNIDLFIETLKKEKPKPSEIVHIKREQLILREFNSFNILESDSGNDDIAMIPADLAICTDCLQELFDESNPRFMHPFISCMACGPRYTIIDKIPYDRENTSMIEFPMCKFCNKEYTNREDRRYHAQTISCHDCGPMIEYKLSENNREAASIGFIGLENVSEKIIKKAMLPIATAWTLISFGNVIAFKGVGGYNLICSPFNREAIIKLRKIKGREEKPFAVMFKDMEQIKKYCHVNKEEENLLTSSARPIVLLLRKSEEEFINDVNDKAKSIAEELFCDETYRSSRFIGCFLPSMAAQYMLLEHSGPLIVTSANLSDMPMIKDDEEMFKLLDKEPLLSGVFYNERKIRIILDDSVVRVIDGQPQMIRRSKGYAPMPLYINNILTKDQMILAVGGQLKSSFCLSKGSFAYVSQYFGDLDSNEAITIYEKNIYRMKELFRVKPQLVVCDMHPNYNTTKFAENYINNNLEDKIELIRVQHHHAHVASVMAEHDLKGAVIGVAFDGTGYGTDGAVWGGEFLICEGAEFIRASHLEYINMLGGDSSMKEGWKSAMSYVYAYENGYNNRKGDIHLDISEIIKFSNIKENSNWEIVSAALKHGVNNIKSSSVGRIFDAVAALLDIQDVNRYEGECAIMLENAAVKALKFPGKSRQNDLALKFHYDVAEMILNQCKKHRAKYKTNKVALTGGVFQNKILMDKSLELLRNDDFEAYYNISVSPNDGGICLGQNYIGMQYLISKSNIN
ncbi:carbamoyltransferase HypF [Anaerovorax odorimutans]|uniref:carbamoyltransferase HypF n=1 Tax=Anaerovorax odorimutans TaxID=109327 RepID=UPI00041E24B9|nr:carbamoyltransferase HypF [Anaerovorax odorimutans]